MATAAAVPPSPNFDAVGVFWMTLMGVWTAAVLGGAAFLYRHRTMPFLKLRGLPLSFAAVALLHLYWAAVQTVYSIGHLFPDGLEFWIMSIWLPFGVALFHASNSRFLHVAEAQKRFARIGRVPTRKPDGREAATALRRFRGMDYSARMLIYVCVGMAFQLVMTLVMYLLSRKFHPSFGIPGTEVRGTPDEQMREKARGWEWWPSLFWQFLWAWVVAPIILWRARGIRDTQGWRVQTIACCLANLHAAPLWVVALHVDAMRTVNRWFAPPQWIALSIMLIEIFTIFLPCWQVRRHRSLRQETLDTLAEWEAKTQAAVKGGPSVLSVSTKTAGAPSASWRSLPSMERGAATDNASSKSVLMMEALEHTLEKNPEPLQTFSALQDFSGENIAFLTSVAAWKAAFAQLSARDAFDAALRIYTEYVGALDAEFPVNLASDELRRLEGVFEASARSLYGDKRLVDPGTPFETVVTTTAARTAPPPSRASEKPIFSPDAEERDGDARSARAMPPCFDVTVFDDAEASIKYLVLTNTWPKYVKEKRSSEGLPSRSSQDSLMDGTGNRWRTVGEAIGLRGRSQNPPGSFR